MFCKISRKSIFADKTGKLKAIQSLALIAIGIGGIVLTPTNAAAVTLPGTLYTVNLGWNAVAETDIQGYRIHVGTQSLQYTGSYDTGLALTYLAGGLEYGKTYYFSVTAIGSTGLESLLSNELVVTVAPPPLPTASHLVTTGTGQSGLQWTFPRAALGSSPEFLVSASPDLVTWTMVDTILPAQASGGDTLNLQFTWPLQVVGNRRFFRLTAKNWMGNSTAP